MSKASSAFVGCDKNGTCLAFTVYNFSQNFGMIIGDLFSLADPFVIDVDVSVTSLFGTTIAQTSAGWLNECFAI